MGTGAKGTISNPYTMAEFEELADAGLWQGGYVEDDSGNVAYMMAELTVTGYSGYSGDGSDGSDYDPWGSDPWGSDPWGSDPNGSDDYPWNGDDGTGGTGGTGGTPGGGTSGGGGGGHHNSGDTTNLISESEVESLIRQAAILSNKLASFLAGLRQNGKIIRAVPTPEHKYGYYNKYDKNIYLTIHTKPYNIWHELTHLHQDEYYLLGKDGNDIYRSSNNEFQAYMIQNIVDSMRGYFREPSFRNMGFGTSEAEELFEFVIDHSGGDGINEPFWIGQEVLDYLNNGDKERWVNNFIHYWEQQASHPLEYTRPYYPNYDWRWEDYFVFLGIEIRSIVR